MGLGGSSGGVSVNRLYQDTTTSNQLPDWVQAAGQNNYDRAEQVYSRPWEGYQGERVADFTGDQQNGFDATRQAAATPNTGTAAATALAGTAATSGANESGLAQSNGAQVGQVAQSGPSSSQFVQSGNGGGGMGADPHHQMGQNVGTALSRMFGGQGDEASRILSGAANGYQAETGRSVPGMNSNGSQQNGVGSIQSYMSPYLKSMMAPQMQEIDRQQGVSDARMGQQQAMDGAFGDARSGVAQAENERNFDQQRQNLVGTTMGNAFNTAQQLQQSDLSRAQNNNQFNANLAQSNNQFNAGAENSANSQNAQLAQNNNQFNTTAANQNGQFNAGQRDTALNRMFTGANALSGLDSQNTALSLQKANALVGIGQQQQALQQQKDTNGYNDFTEARGWDANQLTGLQNALKNTPYNTSQETSGWKDQATSVPASSGGGGGVGSALGAIGGLFSI